MDRGSRRIYQNLSRSDLPGQDGYQKQSGSGSSPEPYGNWPSHSLRRLNQLVAFERLDLRHQPISPPRDCLNELWFLYIVFQCLSQFGNAPGEHVISDKRVAPDRTDQSLFRDGVPGIFRETDEYFKNFRFKSDRFAVPRNSV